ncbi:MAG: sulfurtransferase, partial [Planctomycetota bacterium]
GVYGGFASEWLPDPSRPLEHLPRYRQLVGPHWLHTLLDTGAAPTCSNGRTVVCQAHFRNPDDYHAGHIPGAISLDTELLEDEEDWDRRSPAAVEAALCALGIDHETTVVLYGRFGHPDNDDPWPGRNAGHLAAFRCAFIMLQAGVRDVRILNGGLRAWEDAGLPVVQEHCNPSAVESFGAAVPARPELAVDLPEAQEILADPEANLVCVRSWPEYIGAVSGYHYIADTGRIPGAVFADCGSDAYHMENYRNLDHTTREYHEIAANWRRSGIHPEQRNAFYCGTGWRGSEAFFNAWLMGWPRVAVYDGGWLAWSRAGLPSEQGDPRDEPAAVDAGGH